MARSVVVIQDQIEQDLVAYFAVIGVTIDRTQWSRRNMLRLLCNVFANATAIVEQLFDQNVTDTENRLLAVAPQTNAWWKAQMLKFQYNADDPQVIQLDTTTFVPYYPTVNTDYQIIKYCSVNAGGLGTTIIKCAAQTSGLPSALDAGQIDAAQSFVNTIANPGINYFVVSNPADELYSQMTIYYKGQYSAVIATNVIASINNFLNSLPFDGAFQLDDYLTAIRNTTGVTRIVFNNIQLRRYDVTFGSGTVLVADNAWITDSLISYAGYIITETTSGHTINDSVTYIAE